MLREVIKDIISTSHDLGWILEPEAKRLLSLAGLKVPRFKWARGLEEAILLGEEIGYPLVAKVVSPKAMHKTDLGGVVVGLESATRLAEVFNRLSGSEVFRQENG